VPLAAVLWGSGISFGGVLAFLYAHLIVLALLDVYRRYYGWRMAAYIGAVFFATMVISGLVMDVAFTALGLVPPPNQSIRAEMAHFSLVKVTEARSPVTPAPCLISAVPAPRVTSFGGLVAHLGCFRSDSVMSIALTPQRTAYCAPRRAPKFSIGSQRTHTAAGHHQIGANVALNPAFKVTLPR
jgi:MFS family permease